MKQSVDFEKLRRFSADIREETIRAIGTAGFGHIGGSVFCHFHTKRLLCAAV